MKEIDAQRIVISLEATIDHLRVSGILLSDLLEDVLDNILDSKTISHYIAIDYILFGIIEDLKYARSKVMEGLQGPRQ